MDRIISVTIKQPKTAPGLDDGEIKPSCVSSTATARLVHSPPGHAAGALHILHTQKLPQTACLSSSALTHVCQVIHSATKPGILNDLSLLH